MDYQEFHRRLIQQLDRVLAAKPHGTLARAQRQMGVNSSYVRHWRRGESINMPRLLELLRTLEVEPFEFFARALRPDHVQEFEIDLLATTLEETEALLRSDEAQQAMGMMQGKGIWDE